MENAFFKSVKLLHVEETSLTLRKVESVHKIPSYATFCHLVIGMQY